MDSDSESKLSSLISQLLSPLKTDSENTSLMIQIASVVSSMDLELQPKPDSKLMSLVTQAISVFNAMDLKSHPDKLKEFISLISHKLSLVNSVSDSEFMSLYREILKLKPKLELISIIHNIITISMFKKPDWDWELLSLLAETNRFNTDDLEPEQKLKSLLSQLFISVSPSDETMQSEEEPRMDMVLKVLSLISFVSQITSLFISVDFDLQPKPESKFMSVITQIFYVANSILESDPQWEIISLITQMIPLINSIDPKQEPPSQQLSTYIYSSGDSELEIDLLFTEIVECLDESLDSESEEEWEPDLLTSMSPQLKVQLIQGKFQVKGKGLSGRRKKRGNVSLKTDIKFT